MAALTPTMAKSMEEEQRNRLLDLSLHLPELQSPPYAPKLHSEIPDGQHLPITSTNSFTYVVPEGEVCWFNFTPGNVEAQLSVVQFGASTSKETEPLATPGYVYPGGAEFNGAAIMAADTTYGNLVMNSDVSYQAYTLDETPGEFAGLGEITTAILVNSFATFEVYAAPLGSCTAVCCGPDELGPRRTQDQGHGGVAKRNNRPDVSLVSAPDPSQKPYLYEAGMGAFRDSITSRKKVDYIVGGSTKSHMMYHTNGGAYNSFVRSGAPEDSSTQLFNPYAAQSLGGAMLYVNSVNGATPVTITWNTTHYVNVSKSTHDGNPVPLASLASPNAQLMDRPPPITSRSPLVALAAPDTPKLAKQIVDNAVMSHDVKLSPKTEKIAKNNIEVAMSARPANGHVVADSGESKVASIASKVESHVKDVKETAEKVQDTVKAASDTATKVMDTVDTIGNVIKGVFDFF